VVYLENFARSRDADDARFMSRRRHRRKGDGGADSVIISLFAVAERRASWCEFIADQAEPCSLLAIP